MSAAALELWAGLAAAAEPGEEVAARHTELEALLEKYQTPATKTGSLSLPLVTVR